MLILMYILLITEMMGIPIPSTVLRRGFQKWFETKFLTDFKTNRKILEKYFNNSIELQINESSVIIDKKDFLTKGFDKKNQ